MSVNKEVFGINPDKKIIEKITIANDNGYKVSIITLGATLCEFYAKDKNGNSDDILLGFDTLDGFLNFWDYQGATVGPVANRIGNGKFTIDCKEYNITKNEKDCQTLHSAGEFNNAIWKFSIIDDKSVCFTYLSKDGINGFPGNIDVKVTYLLDNQNALHISYEAVSDKKTPISITNHSYFNLKGFDGGSICDHYLKLYCSKYTPVDKLSIPTGEIADVKDTPFDFIQFRQIGERINDDFAQLNLTGGYDHNFCVDGYNGEIKKIAEVYEETSGRLLETYTDLPGVQFYAGNFLKGDKGKKAVPMNYRNGFCLETQFYPDSVNHTEFPNEIFEPGQMFKSETVYKLSLK